MPRVFRSESGSLEALLPEYLAFVVQHSGAHSAFIADSQGLPMVSQGEVEAEAAASSLLYATLDRLWDADSECRRISIDLDSERCLVMQWVGTQTESFVLGIATPQPIHPDILDHLARQLCSAVTHLEARRLAR